MCVGAGGVGLGVCTAFGHAVKSSAAAAKDSVKTAVVMSAAPLFCLKEKNLVFELLFSYNPLKIIFIYLLYYFIRQKTVYTSKKNQSY